MISYENYKIFRQKWFKNYQHEKIAEQKVKSIHKKKKKSWETGANKLGWNWTTILYHRIFVTDIVITANNAFEASLKSWFWLTYISLKINLNCVPSLMCWQECKQKIDTVSDASILKLLSAFKVQRLVWLVACYTKVTYSGCFWGCCGCSVE